MEKTLNEIEIDDFFDDFFEELNALPNDTTEIVNIGKIKIYKRGGRYAFISITG